MNSPTLPNPTLPKASSTPPATRPATGLRRLAPPSALLWLVLVLLVAALVVPALTGGDTSSSDNPDPLGQARIQVPAAAYNPVLPTETGMAQPTATEVATPNLLTPVIATHVAFATNVALFRENLRTQVALTHAPTITPGRPQARSSPTPIMGMLPGCGNTSTYGPQAVSCWRGVVNGQIVEVYAGREGSEGDSTQGIVRVHVRGQQGQGDGIYQTPNRVGAVGIASVDGTEFTLETVDQPTPQVFVFDLATRSWVP